MIKLEDKANRQSEAMKHQQLDSDQESDEKN
jgi:hypothetical protein